MHELVGIDTGGTFTDFILYKNGSFVSFKIPSTPDSPEKAIIQGLMQLEVTKETARIVHGTTVATNTLLEGTGAKTAFITNKGLRDILLIGRQAREQLYSVCPHKARELITADDCYEIDARVDASGQQITSLTSEEMQKLQQRLQANGFEAIAVCMLFSFLNDDHEKALEEVLKQDYFVSRSSQVMPEQREYERAVVTWLNSYLGPKTSRYLRQLQLLFKNTIQVMQSDATTLPANTAGEQAVRLLLSGPAGGVMAASVIAKQCTQPKLLTLDMGGTSTDVSLIDQNVKFTSNTRIAEFPLAISLLDIHTIGAGGGSIARVDDAGGLHVGPQSAGAQPGPACYAQGGLEATITDANVVLGRLPSLSSLDSGLEVDKQAAETAIKRLANKLSCSVIEAARGIIDMANAHMAQALRVISIHRGHDPGQFSLFPFGGASGVHMCAIAKRLGIQQILVPTHAGTLSALGMLFAPVGQMASRSLCQIWNAELENSLLTTTFSELQDDAVKLLEDSGIDFDRVDRWLELRYQGQSSSIRLPWFGQTTNIVRDFEVEHKRRYGFTLSGHSIELVTLRVWVFKETKQMTFQQIVEGTPAKIAGHCDVDGEAEKVPIYLRSQMVNKQQIKGPCIILEQTATLFVDSDWSGEVMSHGHIRLQMSTDCP